MTPDQSAELLTSTRRKFEESFAEVVGQVGAAIPTKGASLVGTAYSGSRLVFYGARGFMIKKVLKSQHTTQHNFSNGALMAPGIGTLRGTDVSSFDYHYKVPETYSSSHTQPALEHTQWAAETSPSNAPHLLHLGVSDTYPGDMSRRFQRGVERLERGVKALLAGGVRSLGGESGQKVGALVSAAVAGELLENGPEASLSRAVGNSIKAKVVPDGRESAGAKTTMTWINYLILILLVLDLLVRFPFRLFF